MTDPRLQLVIRYYVGLTAYSTSYIEMALNTKNLIHFQNCKWQKTTERQCWKTCSFFALPPWTGNGEGKVMNLEDIYDNNNDIFGTNPLESLYYAEQLQPRSTNSTNHILQHKNVLMQVMAHPVVKCPLKLDSRHPFINTRKTDWYMDIINC